MFINKGAGHSHSLRSIVWKDTSLRVPKILQVVFEEEKWDWCNVSDNKQTIAEFTTLEEEGDANDLESASTTTPTSLQMSSSVTLKGGMDSLEQESSGKSI